MKPTHVALCVLAAILAVPVSPAAARDSLREVLRDLNRTDAVKGTTKIKSYPIIFDAYMEMGPPPMPISEEFNLGTIHAKMDGWSTVAGWAESNAGMGRAILAAQDQTLFGLAYGLDDIETKYRDADLVAEVGVDGQLRESRFPYLDAIDVVAAYGTAEAYRLLEADRAEDGLNMMVATIFLLRQCCDREFLAEQLRAITALNEALSNLRDLCYTYRSKGTPDLYSEIAIKRIPFLRPDRSRLLLPEGDRRVSEALINAVFDSHGQPDREAFPRTFAAIQSKKDPLTRFGAARRWREIAEIHDSLEASLNRLQLVYDDWWRRWRVEEYDPILELPTQFELTNPVRYAAVIYSMQNIEQLFVVRNQLLASVYGTSMAVGLCGYIERFGKYPSDTDAMYALFVRRRSDQDPFDINFDRFKYRVLNAGPFATDTPEGRLRFDGGCILYSRGQDHEDDRGEQHRDDGADGDIVLWPPIKAVSREQGLID